MLYNLSTVDRARDGLGTFACGQRYVHGLATKSVTSTTSLPPGIDPLIRNSAPIRDAQFETDGGSGRIHKVGCTVRSVERNTPTSEMINKLLLSLGRHPFFKSRKRNLLSFASIHVPFILIKGPIPLCKRTVYTTHNACTLSCTVTLQRVSPTVCQHDEGRILR